MLSTHAATAADLERYLTDHRAGLVGHCYRMLGSAADAEDAVQDTMVKAWRNLERFEGRSSLRTWLFRIATHVCLDHLSSKARRMRPMEIGSPGSTESTLNERPASHWVEPIPDALVLPQGADPLELATLRQSIRLAFVAALQHLPARQRAVLLLADVLGFSVAEIAETLETTVAAVNSALQRARATLASKDPGPQPANLDEEQTVLVDRFADAFQRYDIDLLETLLRNDATLSMPPYDLWLRGLPSIRSWLLGPGLPCEGSRLVPTAASASPSFGQYRPAPDGGHLPWALIVLELDGNRIASMNYFLDTQRLFPLFGLPDRL